MPTATVTYSVLAVNCNGHHLQSPPPPRMGRPGDYASGEWDGYYALPEKVRRFVRRNLCGGDLAPDQVAQTMGLDATAFWSQLEVAVGAALDNRPVQQYDDSAPALQDLAGPREAAAFFGVEVNTVAQWRRRHDFPLPLVELSGRLIWDVRDLERWGIENARLELAENVPSF